MAGASEHAHYRWKKILRQASVLYFTDERRWHIQLETYWSLGTIPSLSSLAQVKNPKQCMNLLSPQTEKPISVMELQNDVNLEQHCTQYLTEKLNNIIAGYFLNHEPAS